MDDDEVFTLVAASVLTLITAISWYRMVLLVRPLRGPVGTRFTLAITPLLCLLILLFVLAHWADHEVRENAGYIALFMAVGGMWLGVTRIVLAVFGGISARGDALERCNPAAAISVVGALLAGTTCFSGANIGEGPTIWTTIGPAALGTAAMFLVWIVYGAFAQATDAITIDRDVAAGLRRFGFYLATAIVIGRAVAGDWVSEAATWNDLFMQGWPALVLALIAAIIDRRMRPTAARPRRQIGVAGLLPAAGYIFLAIFWVVSFAGPLELKGHR